jgi:hypothetical protein
MNDNLFVEGIMESKNIKDFIAKLTGDADFRKSFEKSPKEALEDCGIQFTVDEKKQILDQVAKLGVEKLEERISARGFGNPNPFNPVPIG